MKRYQLYTFLCDCLNIDFHPKNVKQVAEKLSSGTLEWKRIVSLASNHYVLQIIYRIFRENQLLDKVPEEVVTEMKRIHTLIEDRNKEMIELSVEINQILKNAGIDPVFTKGMGYLMHDLYKDQGDRLLADVDLLIPYDSLEVAVRALKDNGFAHLKDLDPKQVPKLKHYPRIFKPGSMVTFELHWEPIGYKYRNMLTKEMVMAEKINPDHFPDCYTMSWKHAIQHNFIHSQLEHRAHSLGKVLLRNMYDLALLSKKADVNKALEALDGYQKQAASYIVLTEETFKLKNLSSNAIQEKVSKFFRFHYELNLRYATPSRILRLLVRIYHSYIRKFFRSFIDKELRKQNIRHLSSKSWYKHHFNTYRKMLGRPQK